MFLIIFDKILFLTYLNGNLYLKQTTSSTPSVERYRHHDHIIVKLNASFVYLSV